MAGLYKWGVFSEILVQTVVCGGKHDGSIGLRCLNLESLLETSMEDTGAKQNQNFSMASMLRRTTYKSEFEEKKNP